ncbi:MAG TPA: 4a-hydroxytetrahydrobiopterin dehydratase [Micromonosporaceae bacterium]|jgi:4a-hydroxytetrahydrobiopterin dehydratase|nr:4a-hydroxytetrahydrobiopterin dehydratase [Micromonosporaceae bacterium]
MGKPLDDAAISAALADLPDWSGDSNALSRTASLPTFPAAISVVDKVAVVAEELDHHPDIDIRWATLKFELSTYDAGHKVTESDIALAHRIDAILNSAT